MQNPVPKKRLSLPTILICLFCSIGILFGKDIAYGASSIIISLFKIDLSLANIVYLLQNMTIFGGIVSLASGGILCFYLLRSRLQIDMPKTRKQITVLGTTLAIGFFVVSSLFVPATLAGNFTATAQYHLQTPLPIAEAYVGQYTNSSYFYINGATWANALVDSNKTLVQQTALNSVSSGNIWSEVSFDYTNLACPANVSFTERVNGVERTFGNVANSQGSPYTITAGAGADANYYFAEDRKGTILWSSTDAHTVFNSVPANNAISLASGTYWINNSIMLGGSLIGVDTNTTIIKAMPNMQEPMIVNRNYGVTGDTFIFIESLTIDGNRGSGANVSGIKGAFARGSQFKDLIVRNCNQSAFQSAAFGSPDNARSEVLITNCKFHANANNCIELSSSDQKISFCEFWNYGGAGVRLNGPIGNIQILHNHFYSSGTIFSSTNPATGIYVKGWAGLIDIQQNQLENLDKEAIYFDTTTEQITWSNIIGNTIWSVGQLKNNTYNAIHLGSGSRNNIIKDNHIREYNNFELPTYNLYKYAIYDLSSATDPDYFDQICNNDVQKGGTGTIYTYDMQYTSYLIRGVLIHDNIGFISEDTGTATFNGTGTPTTYTIQTDVDYKFRWVSITPASSDVSASQYFVTTDNSNIYIHFTDATVSGTNNIVFKWYVKV